MTKELNKAELLEILKKKSATFSKSKWVRFAGEPQKYFYSLWLRKIIFPLKHRGTLKTIKTFWGDDFRVMMPAGNDIYLHGTKSYFAEVHLAAFLIRRLEPGHVFFDVGAHFGYFSLLACRLTGDAGKVYAFEPTRSTFDVLKKNLETCRNAFPVNKAIADHEGEAEFIEFSQVNSENNSVKPVFASEDLSTAKKYTVPLTSVDGFCREKSIFPDIIKVDAEGLELDVIKGMESLLREKSPIIIMEFVNPAVADNKDYEAAVALLRTNGYNGFLIIEKGDLLPSASLMENLQQHNAESDNVVFMKP